MKLSPLALPAGKHRVLQETAEAAQGHGRRGEQAWRARLGCPNCCCLPPCSDFRHSASPVPHSTDDLPLGGWLLCAPLYPLMVSAPEIPTCQHQVEGGLRCMGGMYERLHLRVTADLPAVKKGIHVHLLACAK